MGTRYYQNPFARPSERAARLEYIERQGGCTLKKLSGLIALGFIAGMGASRFMASKGYGAQEQLKGKAEQLKGRVEQAVGKATGSEETQARGKIDEATGKAREKIAEIKGNARAAMEKAATT